MRYLNLSTRYYREELEGVVPDQRLGKLQEKEQWRLQVMRDVVPLQMQAEWLMPASCQHSACRFRYVSVTKKVMSSFLIMKTHDLS